MNCLERPVRSIVCPAWTRGIRQVEKTSLNAYLNGGELVVKSES